MKCAIVPFFNYGYGHNDLLWNFFVKHMAKWIKYVDVVYVIDSGCGLDYKDSKVKIVHKGPDSHWQNMNEAIRSASEDQIMLLDSDMVIYDPEVVKRGFEDLDSGYDAVGILDSSGGVDMSRFSLMRENVYRSERRRLCPYLCFLKKSALRENFDFTPRGGDNWTDSMGTVTEQLLEDVKSIKELRDDRSTISQEDDGKITSVQWLDAPPKKWSLEENPNLGYYHIRNFGGGLKIYSEGSFGLVPGREARRLLAWVYILLGTLPDNKYLKMFKEYHAWLKDL